MSKLDRYWDAVAKIRAVGVSEGRWVTVIRESTAEIDVRITPGMLRRCTPDQVAAEIRSALLAALADHRRQYIQKRIDFFGSPVGARPFVPKELR